MKEFGPEMPSFSELAEGVQRLVAPNPSMMTGPGTNTYLLGIDEIAVLDPGPIIEGHIERIVEQGRGRIRQVVVTHTHPDHSPAAVRVAELTGAELLGRPAPGGEHQDRSFEPDRVLEDGERISIGGLDVEVIHTPGHASNHLCFRDTGLNWIFTGDHVIDGSTVVINPPDGNMTRYLDSLRRLKAMRPEALAPGHGEIIDDPARAIDWIIDHRLEREARVLDAVRANSNLTTRALVPLVYKDVSERLYGLAERSLLAHLLKLEEDGAVTCRDNRWSPI